jgi:hypothetical protein
MPTAPIAATTIELNHDRRQAFNDRQNDGRTFGNHNG